MTTDIKNEMGGSNKRIAKNTIVLYFRMLFLMLVSLFTSRVILDALGEEDYGIYNIVAGFIMMFNVVSAALINANTRFFNIEIGRGDLKRLSLVFSSVVSVHICVSILIILILETIGLWYINHVMVIPNERLMAANWCYQLSVFNFCMIMINIPYRACIIAHEKMKTFAYVSIVDGVGQLLIAYLVIWNPFDRLIYYAIMLFVLQNIVRYTYQSYCRRNFSECHYEFVFEKKIIREILGFCSWNFFGNGSNVLKTYGGSLILNLFFGPSINAARGLAIHVNNAISSFSTNFLMAITPQITQSYAKNDVKRMLELMTTGARFSFYLLLVISMPIIFNTEFLLRIWLKEVPNYTVVFVQLSLVNSIIYALTRPLVTGQNATGNIKFFQLTIGSIELMNIPVSYLFLYWGFPPYYVLVVSIILEIISVFARIFIMPRTIKEFNPLEFSGTVLGNCLCVSILSSVCPLVFKEYLSDSYIGVLVNCIVCVISAFISVFFWGMNKRERAFVISKIIKLKNRVNPF